MGDHTIEKIRELALYYGPPSRFNQMTEEMSELIQAFCKYNRVRNGEPCRKSMKEIWDSIIEELTDVYITMEQVLFLLSTDDYFNAQFAKHLKEKTDRAYKEYQEKKAEESKNE